MGELEVDDRVACERLDDVVERARFEAEARPAPVDLDVS